MTEDARPGLIRVVYFEQTSALMMGAGVLLSEGLLLTLLGTPDRLEVLLVGTVAVTLVSLALVPFGFRLPARRRRKYEQAAQIDTVGEPCAGPSRATARWERENGAALWQGAPGVLGARGPVYRVAADAGT